MTTDTPTNTTIDWKLVGWPIGLAVGLTLYAWIEFWTGPIGTKRVHKVGGWPFGALRVPVSVAVVVTLLFGLYLVCIIFATVFVSRFWTFSTLTRAVSILAVLTSMLGLIGAFAATYLQESHESARCFGSYLGHTNAVYVSVTTFTTWSR